MSSYKQKIGNPGVHEFVSSDGYRAEICLVVETEVHENWDHDGNCRCTQTHDIDPALAEVWPCVARPLGHYAYATDPLTGDALKAWLAKYHDELVDLALDMSADEAEAADERRRER